jgi:hypothetical protein
MNDIPQGAVPGDQHPGLERVESPTAVDTDTVPSAESKNAEKWEEITEASGTKCETPSCANHKGEGIAVHGYPVNVCITCARQITRFAMAQPAFHEIHVIEHEIRGMESRGFNEQKFRELETRKTELQQLMWDAVDTWLSGNPQVISITPVEGSA